MAQALSDFFADKNSAPFDGRIANLNLNVLNHIKSENISFAVGKGRFSEQFEGSVLVSREPIPELNVKTVLKVMKNYDYAKKSFLNELRAGTLRHPAIQPVFATYEDSVQLCVLSAFSELGDLEDLIKLDEKRLIQKEGVILEPCARLRVLIQISSAILYIHKLKFTHNDIKLANIVVDHCKNARLIDFGLYQKFDAVFDKISGTPCYLPNEINDETRIEALMFYSFGVVILAVLTGESPESSEVHITFGVESPESSETNGHSGVQSSESSETHGNSRVQSPESSEEHGDSRVETPMSSEKHEHSGVESPKSSEEYGDSRDETPESSGKHEHSGVEFPKSSEKHGDARNETPMSSRKHEHSGVESPKSSEEHGDSRDVTPMSSRKHEHSGVESPKSSEEHRDSRDETPESSGKHEHSGVESPKSSEEHGYSRIETPESSESHGYSRDVSPQKSEEHVNSKVEPPESSKEHGNSRDVYNPDAQAKPETHFKHDNCENCIINPVLQTQAFQHIEHNQCSSEVQLCRECIRSHYLNPIFCPTCGECRPNVDGASTALICLAGDGIGQYKKEERTVFQNDITLIANAFTERLPSVLCFDSERDFQNVCNEVGQNKDRITVVLFYSGHYDPKEGRFILKQDKYLSKKQLNKAVNKLINKKSKVVLFLGCCNAPSVSKWPARDGSNSKQAICDFIQVNATREDQAADADITEGSLFTRYIVQALDPRKRCKNCKICDDFSNDEKSYDTIKKIVDYVQSHYIANDYKRNIQKNIYGSSGSEEFVFSLKTNITIDMKMIKPRSDDTDSIKVEYFSSFNEIARKVFAKYFNLQDVDFSAYDDQIEKVIKVEDEITNESITSEKELVKAWNRKHNIRVSLCPVVHSAYSDDLIIFDKVQDEHGTTQGLSRLTSDYYEFRIPNMRFVIYSC